MTTETDWEDVETNGPAVTNLRSERVYELTKYVYIITERRFMLQHNPEKLWTDKQFNIRHQDLIQYLPDRMNPSEYVIRNCSETNVVNHRNMAPDQKLMYLDTDGDKVFNVFPPNIPIPTDVELPDPEPMLSHMYWLYNKDHDHFMHVLQWMAHFLYRPEKRIGHGILTSGEPGTGKSTIGKTLGSLVSANGFANIRPELFVSDYQEWIEGTRLCVVEEVKMFGQGDKYNKVKSYFTEDQFHINPKLRPSYKISNFVHYLFYSNYVNPMPLPEGDRRMFYVHSRVSASDRDAEYYNKLTDGFLDLSGEKLGAFAFAKYLRDEILPNVPENFSTTPPPVTRDSQRSITSNRTVLQDWIEEEIEAGKGMFAPQIYFRWKALKARIKDHLGITVRAAEESTLAQAGVYRKRVQLKGKKEDICWLETDKEFNAEMDRMLNDTTTSGRAKLYNHFYEGQSEW